MKAFRFFFPLLALCASFAFAEEEPVQTCPMPALKESLNKAYADLTEDPDNQEKRQMFVDLFEKSLHKYDCRRPFDTGPVPAWWLSQESGLLFFKEDAIKWINLLASMKSAEAKKLFGSQLFRSTLDGAYAEMYYELSLQAEKELSGLLSLPASAEEIPEGWRPATPEELDLEGYGISRTDSPHYYTRAEADFNGDGIPDIAYSLKSTSFSGEALVIRLSEGTEFSWKVLSETNWGEEYPNVGLAMGVDVAEPEKLQTACGKGYLECSEGEPEEIDLKVPGICYFKLGSASSIFYWDKPTNEFVRVWISD